MEKVKLVVKGAGSIYVSGDAVPKEILDFVGKHLEEREYIIEKIKRGPKKRVVVADEGSEAVPAE